MGFLGKEDPLEEEVTTHSSFLARKIPWTEDPGELQSLGLQRVEHDWAHMQFSSSKKPFYLYSLAQPLISYTVVMTNKLSYLIIFLFFMCLPNYEGASLVAQLVKSLPAVQETWVWFLGQEDLLEKEMATHSSIIAWRIPWTEEPCGLQSTGLQELDTT